MHRDKFNQVQVLICHLLGIDYRHPALGNGFGEGHKVRLGKNLVPAKNDEKFGIDPLGEDNPFDPCLNVDSGNFLFF